jgi:hypothetical protein
METQIAKTETQPLETGLATLREEAKGIMVKTPDDYEKAGRLLTTITNYQKDVKNKLNPFVEFARRNLESVRQEMQKYLNGAEEIRNMVSTPMADFKRQERLAAEAEERRINEDRRRQAEADAAELRKQQEAQAEADRKKREKEIKEAQKAGDLNKREAEKMRKESEQREREQKEQAARDAAAMAANVQDVKVQANTPKIAGTRGRVQYFAEFTDFDAVLKAYIGGRTDLRKYIMGNDQELSRQARETKSSKAMQLTVPGIRAWDEDRI